MIDPDCVEVKVEDLKEGDKVDLESCPYLKNHPTAEYEYAEVCYVNRESDNCVAVGYEGMDEVGYQAGTILKIYPKPKLSSSGLDAVKAAIRLCDDCLNGKMTFDVTELEKLRDDLFGLVHDTEVD